MVVRIFSKPALAGAAEAASFAPSPAKAGEGGGWDGFGGEESVFRWPAGGACVGAVGGGDQRYEGGDVGVGGVAECEFSHGGPYFFKAGSCRSGGSRELCPLPCEGRGGLGRGALGRASGQQPAHLAQRGHENLDLLVRVVERQRRAAGGADAEPLQQRMRAVLAGADRHADRTSTRLNSSH